MRGMAGWTSSVLAFALVACSGGEDQPANDARTPNVAQNAAGNAAGAPVPDANAAGNVAEPEADSAVSTIYGDCYLRIDGKVYLDIKKDCPIVSLDDGNGSLILNSDGEHQVKTYFAYLTPNGDGTAGASWNEEPGVTHAQALLSENLKRDGACWFDSRVRICATQR